MHIVTPFVINFTRKIWKIRGGGIFAEKIFKRLTILKTATMKKLFYLLIATFTLYTISSCENSSKQEQVEQEQEQGQEQEKGQESKESP